MFYIISVAKREYDNYMLYDNENGMRLTTIIHAIRSTLEALLDVDIYRRIV